MLTEVLIFGGFWFWTILIAEFVLLILLTEWERWGLALTSALVLIGAFTLFSDVDVIGYAYENPWKVVLGAIAYFIPLGIVVGGIKWYFFLTDTRDKNREAKTNWLENECPKILKGLERGYVQRQSELKAKEDGGWWDKMQRQATQEQKAAQIEKDKEELGMMENRILSFKEAINEEKMNETVWPDWKIYESEYRFYDIYGHRRAITRPKAKDNKARIASWIAWWPAVGFWTLLHDPLRRIGIWLYNRFAKFLERMSLYVWKNEDEFPDPPKEKV